MFPKRVNSLAAIFLAFTFQALGQAKKPKPTHDPPGQLFRHAPMPKATRSIVIPLGDIQFAFDTENLRAHTVWRGKLDLYGPQYINAKHPFISRPNGKLLWGNPPTIPWRTKPPGARFSIGGDLPKGRFIGTTTNGKYVTLRYTLQLPTGETVGVGLKPSLARRGLQRTLSIAPCSRPLWFLANSFPDGTVKYDVTAGGIGGSAVQVTSIPLSYTEPIITEAGTETVYDTHAVETVAEQHWVLVPPHEGEATLTITTHHDGDLPARSGIGSSSSFTVGLINVINALKGQQTSKEDLAKRAIFIEQEVLKENVGSQDQILAAFGGFNRIDFNPDDSFNIAPVIINKELTNQLQDHMLILFTGLSRFSSDIAKDKIENFKNHYKELTQIKEIVDEAMSILQSPSVPIESLGKLLHESWKLKRSLSAKVSTPYIDEIYEAGIKSGAIGGKILGAGGGGFILFFAKPENHKNILSQLKDLVHVSFRFDNIGSKIVVYEPNGFK